jgi:hypothetical protein
MRIARMLVQRLAEFVRHFRRAEDRLIYTGSLLLAICGASDARRPIANLVAQARKLLDYSDMDVCRSGFDVEAT